MLIAQVRGFLVAPGDTLSSPSLGSLPSPTRWPPVLTSAALCSTRNQAARCSTGGISPAHGKPGRHHQTSVCLTPRSTRTSTCLHPTNYRLLPAPFSADRAATLSPVSCAVRHHTAPRISVGAYSSVAQPSPFSAQSYFGLCELNRGERFEAPQGLQGRRRSVAIGQVVSLRLQGLRPWKLGATSPWSPPVLALTKPRARAGPQGRQQHTSIPAIGGPFLTR
jgi:hypothetical protein